jgi:hypothetical protein
MAALFIWLLRRLIRVVGRLFVWSLHKFRSIILLGRDFVSN